MADTHVIGASDGGELGTAGRGWQIAGACCWSSPAFSRC